MSAADQVSATPPHAFAAASASAILIVHVVGTPEGLAEGWVRGPLPVPLPRDKFPSFLYSDAADKPTRQGFLERRVHGLLYGLDQDPVRQHRWIDEGAPALPCGWQVKALELLDYPVAGPAGALLAAHVVLAGSPEDSVQAVTTLANVRPLVVGDVPEEITRPRLERLIAEYLPPARLQNARVGFVVSHVAFPTEPPEGLVPGSQADASLQWSRVLALANEPGALPGHLAEPERQPCDIPLSTTWETCVLKSGAAFVGRSGTDTDPYHELAKALVHSVYLDALLLGLVQRDCVDELSNSIGELWEAGSPARRSTFERNMIRFRSEAWWSDISETAPVNLLLQAFQDSYDLQERQDRLHSDISDISQVLAGERAERTNLLLNIIVVMSFAFGLAALVADPGVWAIVWGVVLAGLGAVGLVIWERRGDRG